MMKKDWEIVEVLSHSRHDWLNKIQLIKGNLSLGKIDRVKEIIEEIVIESQNESNLTNLRLHSLAELLMTYNWEQHHFRLEYEVLGGIKDLSWCDKQIHNWCVRFFSILDISIDVNSDNHLSMSIESFNEEVRFFFDFSGIITNIEQLKNWFHEQQSNQDFIQLTEFQIHNGELMAVISTI